MHHVIYKRVEEPSESFSGVVWSITGTKLDSDLLGYASWPWVAYLWHVKLK